MPSIHPETTIGSVDLTVTDLERSLAFYTGTLGFRELGRADGIANLGVEGSGPLLVLHGEPQAPPRPPRTTGLFHFAILVPSRPDLARVLGHLVESGWPLTGASDHLVSEALYLNDPDGIGIEIYRDRPRDEWEESAEGVRMATLPLDLRALLREADGEDASWRGMPSGTRIGHVHLNVADLDDSEAFYSGVLGFDVTVRGYPGALFVSAGGYHHHLGLNTWNGEGVPPPPEGAVGMSDYVIAVPDEGELDRLEGRLRETGNDAERRNGSVLTHDPAGLRVALRAQAER